MTRISRSAAVLLGCAIVFLLHGDALGAQDGSRLRGRVVEGEGMQPVEDALVRIDGTGHRAFTGRDGSFAFRGVAPGIHRVVVEHLAFGRGTDSLVVGPGSALDLRIRLSRRAIELAPLEVAVLSRDEIERRRRGTARNRVVRSQIEEMAGRALHVGHVLDAHVPGITVDERSGAAGAPFCLEFRRPPSLQAPGGCHSPLVVVDGVRVFDGNGYLNSVALAEIQSIEVLPPAEAGTFYGSRAGWGVVLIETRRPWLDGEGEERARPRETRETYDWDLERGGHPWKRAFGGAALGTAVSLGLVLYAADECSPMNEARDAECPDAEAHAYGAAAFTLPVLGAAAGANLLGRTDGSRGELLRTVLLAATPMLTGYFFATPQDGRGAFDNQALFGKVLVTVGVPAMATLADRLFRDPAPGPGGAVRR